MDVSSLLAFSRLNGVLADVSGRVVHSFYIPPLVVGSKVSACASLVGVRD